MRGAIVAVGLWAVTIPLVSGSAADVVPRIGSASASSAAKKRKAARRQIRALRERVRTLEGRLADIEGDLDSFAEGSEGSEGSEGPEGPEGDAGPPGPRGPAGAQGAAGAEGPAGAEIEPASPAEEGTADANGKVAVLRGFSDPGVTPGQGRFSWSVMPFVPDLAVRTASGGGSATASCPSGYFAVGGGAQVTAQSGSLTGSYPTAMLLPDGWVAKATGGNTVRSYVFCSKLFDAP